jgi:hypothetical protein
MRTNQTITDHGRVAETSALAYQQMASDQAREAEASEWVDGSFGDIDEVSVLSPPGGVPSPDSVTETPEIVP